MPRVPNYLSVEDARNHRHRFIYERAIRVAFRDDGCREILINHHLNFALEGEEPNEVPSADTFLFSHEIMGRIFGDRAIDIMVELVKIPEGERDAAFAAILDSLPAVR